MKKKSKTDFGLTWLVRDARGLTADEKLFLYTVASHQDGMHKTHDKNIADMGFSRSTYYRVRTSLKEKELISLTRRMNGPTVYAIDKPSLDAWVESHRGNPESHGDTPLSRSENPESQDETRQSHGAETKENKKGNEKENEKENNKTTLRDVDSPAADAPGSSTYVPESFSPIEEDFSSSFSPSRSSGLINRPSTSGTKDNTEPESHHGTREMVKAKTAGRFDWDDLDW